MAHPQPAEGVLRQHFCAKQTTFDTWVNFVAGDSIKCIDMSIDPVLNYTEDNEATGTASSQGRTAQDQGGTFSVTMKIKPKAVGTAPDGGNLLAAGFGLETLTGSTSAVYTLTDTRTFTVSGSVYESLQLGRKVGTSLFDWASGCVVEQVEITSAGNANATMTFSGSFARHGHVYGSTVDGIHASGTAIDLNHAWPVSVGSVIKFDTEDNGGNGYTVTAIGTDGKDITITPTLAGALADNDEVYPLLPTWSVTGTNIVDGVNDLMTIGGNAVGVITSKYTIVTGRHGLGNESTADRINRVALGKREVSTTHDVYFLDTETGPLLGGAKQSVNRVIVHRMGPANAGQKAKVDIPVHQMMVSSVQVPEADEATASISGRADMNSAAGDELVLTFD